MQKHYQFNEISIVTNHIIETGKRLVYLSGASASGKSYIWEEIVKQLKASGKKVLLISSDSYYSNESNLKYMLYGTFDHPKLIDYPLLNEDITNYFLTWTINIPNYSFIEKRRTHLTEVNEQFDIIVVEGLYTINELNPIVQDNQGNDILAYKVFVDAPNEEILFRRLIRDQARIKEPLHSIISVMSTVFPMRTVFGKTQQIESDCSIFNDYTIIHHEWIDTYWQEIDTDKISTEWRDKRHYITDYIYHTTHSDSKIIISEVYTQHEWLLDHVKITKTDNDPRTNQKYKSISMTLYHPAISTELHTLLQLAWLEYEWRYNTIHSYYTNKDKTTTPYIIKEQFWIHYQSTW